MGREAFDLWSAFAGLWAAGMLRALEHGALFVAAVWVVCRLLPHLPAAARGWLWWLACAKLLVDLAWAAPLPLAVLPAAPRATVPLPPAGMVMPAPAALPLPHSAEDAGPAIPALRLSRPGAVSAADSPLSMAGLLMGLWAAGLVWRWRCMRRQWLTLRGALRGARLIAAPEIRQETALLAAVLRLRRPPLLLEAPSSPGPLAIGLPRPSVVLPADAMARFTPEELRMALAHELAHVRRGDLWWSLAPHLTQWLFFFFPPAALACREWVIAREAACDVMALRATGAPAAAYGRLLLKLAARDRGPALPALGASPGFEALRRRLTMLQLPSFSHRARWAIMALVATGALTVLPWRLTARAASTAVSIRGRAAAQEAQVLSCERQLAAIGRALAAYRRDHGDLPAHLSDLYPEYVSDMRVFHCPADRSSGSPRLADDYDDEIAPPQDPRPVSYAYYMSPVKLHLRFGGLGPPRPRGADDSWRGQMLAMREQYGDRVPVMRCWHHAATMRAAYFRPLVLSLTLGGSVYRSAGAWQQGPETLAGVMKRMEGDLSQGPAQFLRRWSLGSVASQFGFPPPIPALSAEARALAARLEALQGKPLIPDRVTHLPTDLPAAIGALYHMAGDTDRAIVAYQAALDHLDRTVPYYHAGEWAAAMCLPPLYAAKGQHLKAIAVYRRILQKDPTKWDWYADMAREYEAMGQTRTALALRRKWDPSGLLRNKPAPEFAMVDSAGRLVDMAKLRGRVVLLFFWFSPYPRQVDTARQLAALQREYGAQGLAVVCLVRGADSRKAAAKMGPNPSYPVLLRADAIYQRYGVRDSSMLDIVDRQGKLVAEYMGYGMDPGEERWLAQTAQDLLRPQLASGHLALAPDYR